jgi:general stress protein YciG
MSSGIATTKANQLSLGSRMAKKNAVTEFLSKIGKKGGKARLTKLTPEERSEIARKAGLAGGRGRKKSAK